MKFLSPDFEAILQMAVFVGWLLNFFRGTKNWTIRFLDAANLRVTNVRRIARIEHSDRRENGHEFRIDSRLLGVISEEEEIVFVYTYQF